MRPWTRFYKFPYIWQKLHKKVSLHLMRRLNSAFPSESWKVSAGFPVLRFTPIICAKKIYFQAIEVSWSKPRGQSFQPLSLRVSARKGQSDNRISPCSSSFHHSFTADPKHSCVSFELKKKNKPEGSLREEYTKGSALWESFATDIKYV